ncbi:uncharacterized protein LOC115501620 isoform X2 [Lynx canadensis]|uniref:uncharacterized protein LOC115501620 isoform X2 n=1 Tax=Lynx canadensis TaxID=61383 RepID=UPI0013C4E900|nr:uncharacterized protein LOC115501620 isoform X2 [Lynx canadensis]
MSARPGCSPAPEEAEPPACPWQQIPRTRPARPCRLTSAHPPRRPARPDSCARSARTLREGGGAEQRFAALRQAWACALGAALQSSLARVPEGSQGGRGACPGSPTSQGTSGQHEAQAETGRQAAGFQSHWGLQFSANNLGFRLQPQDGEPGPRLMDMESTPTGEVGADSDSLTGPLPGFRGDRLGLTTSPLADPEQMRKPTQGDRAADPSPHGWEQGLGPNSLRFAF